MHGAPRQLLPQHAFKSRKSNNSAHRCRTHSSSWNAKGSRTLDATSNNFKRTPICTITSAATNVCRQQQAGMGLEVCTELNTFWHTQSWLPHKTIAAKIQPQNFEELFPTWDFELARHERDGRAQPPDQVEAAILMNETAGPPQQHMHLQAGSAQTY